jgi:hypothetical protein
MQREVLRQVQEARGVLPFDVLRKRLPLRARTHSLYRSVRALKRRGNLREVRVDGRRWLAACAVEFGKSGKVRELMCLADAAHGMMTLAAAARGVPTPPIPSPADVVDSYGRRRARLD